MASFECSVCGVSFQVPQKSLDRYPGWTPKYCREHKPAKKGGGTKAAGTTTGASKSGGRRRSGGAAREENLTLAQVLAKYEGGPRDGVFTDGSSVPNPGPGGWGAVWVVDGEVCRQEYGRDPQTTNNRMELKALIEAYRMLPERATETIYTDSRLCVDTITKWAAGWEKRGWKRKGGEIQNLELVQELYALHQAHPNVELTWIAAHAGNRWNEYADSLATAWMRDEL